MLSDLLAVSLTGVILYTPSYSLDGSGQIVDFTFEYLNPAAQRLLGLPERPTLTYKQQWPQSEAHGAFALHVAAYQTGETHELTVQNPTNGSDTTYRLAVRRSGAGLLVSFTDTVGQPRQLQAEAHQAREQQVAAQHEVQQREIFYQVFEQTPALIALLRAPRHRFEYVNPTYHAFFPRRQLIGLDLADATPELVEQGFGALLDQVYQTGETFYGTELPFTPPATEGQLSRPQYFNFTYQAYREAGEVVGVSIFAFDVTDAVVARQQREAQRQQLQAVFAQAPVAICVFQGEDYVLDVVNPPMGEMLGHPLVKLVAQPFFDVLPELRAQGLPELLATVRRTGTPFVAQEQEIQLARHLPGEPGYYNFVYQPLLEADGQISGIVCVATDVSEQVRARQQVQDLNEELAAINEELTAANEELHDSNTRLVRTNVDLDNFIYTASHDLKVPITNIEGLLQALQAQLPAEVQALPEVEPVLDMMQQSVQRFQRTLAYLSDITQLQQEAGQAVQDVSLLPVLEDVLLDLQDLVVQAGARLNVALDTCPAVRFSPKNLRSVVYNLLSNALKYRHPDRPCEVSLHCHQEPGYIVLTVRDNGLGIPTRRHADLFQLFRRLHSHVEGSGVGLYMVKRMVENAGGQVQIESEPQIGTTFRVYFPHD